MNSESWASADRSTACGTGFGSAAAIGPELQARPNDRFYATDRLAHPQSRAPSAKDMLKEAYRRSPEIGAIAELATSFFSIFRERNLEALPTWLESARGTALESFAATLERDIDAVREAL